MDEILKQQHDESIRYQIEVARMDIAFRKFFFAMSKKTGPRIRSAIEVKKRALHHRIRPLTRSQLIAVWKVLSTLSPRERHVMLLRNDLNGAGYKTFEQIGEIFCVTRERIRQIEAKAFRKVNHHTRKNLLRDA